EAYYLEHLTNELERQAYEYFERIEGLGGVVEAIKLNFFQQEIADAAFRFQSEVESGRRGVVGVNGFEKDDEEPPPLLKIDPSVEAKQIARVRALRARRDSTAVETALAEL